MPSSAMTLEDLLAQRLVALAGPVLQRLQAAGRDDALGEVAEDVEREALEERHATRERDDLGTVGDGEQGADLAGPHAVGAFGVGAEPAVEARSGAGGGGRGGARRLAVGDRMLSHAPKFRTGTRYTEASTLSMSSAIIDLGRAPMTDFTSSPPE